MIFLTTVKEEELANIFMRIILAKMIHVILQLAENWDIIFAWKCILGDDRSDVIGAAYFFNSMELAVPSQ